MSGNENVLFGPGDGVFLLDLGMGRMVFLVPPDFYSRLIGLL